MNDKGKILAGVIIFVVAITFPIWYSLVIAQPGAAPEPVLPKGKTECVLPAEEMIPNHMNILDEWRHAVVRYGDKKPVIIGGEKYEKSLTKTCMDCHDNKAEFCDACHTYADVDPYCWDCHVEPKEGE